MYQRGLKAARAHKDAVRDPLVPSWGEPECLMSLAGSNFYRTAPDLAAAEQYARAALALVPYWHYVRDILIPMIETAKIKIEIIGLERAALERWGKGDPQGYLEIMAPDMTYFDPALEKRLDGLAAVKEYIVPFTGKIRIDSYEMINPQVQRYGDVAVLTFNLIDSVKRPDREEKVRWNSTEVYRRIDGNWKIVHSHWSYIKPQLK
jgi:ketosteroid isomerase-like protein